MLLVLALASLVSPVPARAERIPQTIDDTNLWRLRGSVPPRARAEFDRGAVDGSLPMEGMKLVFQLTPEQQSSLNTLLQQQLDPSSPNYHKWLTPEQYADRFGVSPGDMTRVAELAAPAGVHLRPSGAQPHLDWLQRFSRTGRSRFPHAHSSLSGERRDALRERCRARRCQARFVAW